MVFYAVVCHIVPQPVTEGLFKMHGLFIGDEVLPCGTMGRYCFEFSLAIQLSEESCNLSCVNFTDTKTVAVVKG